MISDKVAIFYFSDFTNNKETYGGGRMLEMDLPNEMKVGTIITLDFNFSTQPLCARSPAYNCGIAPLKLDFKVEAGERL